MLWGDGVTGKVMDSRGKERKKRKRFGFKRKLRKMESGFWEERTTGVLKKRGGFKGKIKEKGWV